jgi:hypothetical protein
MLTGKSMAHACGPAGQASHFSKLKYDANPVELGDLKPLFPDNKHKKTVPVKMTTLIESIIQSDDHLFNCTKNSYI